MSKPGESGVELVLQAAFRTTEKELMLGYKMRNTRPASLYLLNVLWEFSPQGDYVKAPHPAYVCLGHGGELRIACQILPLPKGRMVEMRNVPFVTKLPPGAEHVENISLPLPVAEYNFYFPEDDQSKTQTRMAEGLVVTLQFIQDTPAVTVRPAPLAGAIQIYHPNYAAAVETVSCAPMAGQIPVLKRTDPFDEF